MSNDFDYAHSNKNVIWMSQNTNHLQTTEKTPKPLLPLGGLPIIERQIQELKKVGVTNVHILIGYRMKEISDYLDNTNLGLNINYIGCSNISK